MKRELLKTIKLQVSDEEEINKILPWLTNQFAVIFKDDENDNKLRMAIYSVETGLKLKNYDLKSMTDLEIVFNYNSYFLY